MRTDVRDSPPGGTAAAQFGSPVPVAWEAAGLGA
jgi:hypothetical protein